jgi:hypothetical protein
MAEPVKLAAALQNYRSDFGLAPYGVRHSGEGAKGKGYFGMLPHEGGSYSSELSSEATINGKNVEHPLLVPTLNAGELQHLLAGNDPTPDIYRKAQEHAAARLEQGKSPFAQPDELRYPTPKE